MLPSTLPAAAVTSSKPVRLSARLCQSTCATSATRSTPVSRRLWMLAAVLTASRPASVLSALKLLLKPSKAGPLGWPVWLVLADEKGAPCGRLFCACDLAGARPGRGILPGARQCRDLRCAAGGGWRHRAPQG